MMVVYTSIEPGYVEVRWSVQGPWRGQKPGRWNARQVDGVEIDREGDLVAPKARYSALIEGASSLDRILRYQQRDTVIIMGVATNVCCGTTARDAMMLDYKVVFVSDGNAAGGDLNPDGFGPGIVQEAELLTLRACFAMVCTTDELIAQFSTIAAST